MHAPEAMMTSRIPTASVTAPQEPTRTIECDVVVAEQLVDVDRHRRLAHARALHGDRSALPRAGVAQHARAPRCSSGRRRGSSRRSTSPAAGRRASGRWGRCRRAGRRCGCSPRRRYRLAWRSERAQLPPRGPVGPCPQPAGSPAHRRRLAGRAPGRSGDAGAGRRRQPAASGRRRGRVGRARPGPRRHGRAARRPRRRRTPRGDRGAPGRSGRPGGVGAPAGAAHVALRPRLPTRRRC